MLLTNKQIIETTQALFMLDQMNCSSKVSHILANNYLKLKKITEEIDEYRVKLWRENFGKESKINEDHVNVQKYNDTYIAKLNEEVNVDLTSIKIKDLNLDKNTIKPIVLATISCFITDFNK